MSVSYHSMITIVMRGSMLTDTNAVDEQRPGIANHPSIQRQTPSSRDHNQTKNHDHCILDKTPSSTNPAYLLAYIFILSQTIWLIPVTQDSHENLTHNDTNNLEILNRIQPVAIANLFMIPALRKNRLEEWFQVSNGEEHITTSIQTN